MKILNLIASFALVGITAQADGLGTYQSNLHYVNLDPQLQLSVGSTERVKRGYVTVDYDNQEVVLTLIREYYCPAPRACALVMPAPITVRSKIESQYTDRCGAYTVIARDFGLLTPYLPPVANTITVTDMRGNRCPTHMHKAYSATEVVLERNFDYVNEGFVERIETISNMAGDDLVEVK